MLGLAGEAMKRKGDSLHGEGSPKDSAIFSNAGMCLTSSVQSAECDKSRLKWVIIFRLNECGEVGGTRHTSSPGTAAGHRHK